MNKKILTASILSALSFSITAEYIYKPALDTSIYISGETNNTPASIQSCKDILDSGNSTGNGVYTINPQNNGEMQAYCDMTTDGGGWTMIVVMYEHDSPLWDEGTQLNYDPSLDTRKAFAFNSSEIPTHTEVGLGKDLDPTFIEYFNYTYTTGSFNSIVTGSITGKTFNFHRMENNYFAYHDTENVHVLNGVIWNNSLSLEERNAGNTFEWAFSPQNTNTIASGYAMNGSLLEHSSESYAWTVWVR